MRLHRRSEVALYREAGSTRQQLFPGNVDYRIKIIEMNRIRTHLKSKDYPLNVAIVVLMPFQCIF